VRAAYRWVQRVARVLANPSGSPAQAVRQRLSGVLTKMRQASATARASAVREQLGWYVKATKSYWAGLFRCYRSGDLPRTKNDLERLFGSYRYQERRASGRKRGSAGTVVMGAVRVVSSLATRLRSEEGLQLPSGYVERWPQERAELEKRREARR